MESNRSQGAIFFGAGPDPDHLASDGFVKPLGGGITVGSSYRYGVRFANGQVWTLPGGTPQVLWFGWFTYLRNETLKWWFDNTVE